MVTSNNNDWPVSVEQAVGVLLALLPEDEKAKIAVISQDDLISLHFGLGIWIRNNFGLWAINSALLSASGEHNPDDAAGVIIEALWRRLQEETPKVH